MTLMIVGQGQEVLHINPPDMTRAQFTDTGQGHRHPALSEMPQGHIVDLGHGRVGDEVGHGRLDNLQNTIRVQSTRTPNLWSIIMSAEIGRDHLDHVPLVTRVPSTRVPVIS